MRGKVIKKLRSLYRNRQEFKAGKRGWNNLSHKDRGQFDPRLKTFVNRRTGKEDLR